MKEKTFPFQSKAIKSFSPMRRQEKDNLCNHIYDLRLTPPDPITDPNSHDEDLVYLTQKSVRDILQSFRFIYKDSGVNTSTTRTKLSLHKSRNQAA